MELGMLKFEQVTFSYGDGPVLREVTCEIARGSFAGLLGPNGAGKTTLLRLASGTLDPGRGRVMLGGRDLRFIPRAEVAREIAAVGQEPLSGFAFTVREIVVMGRTPYIPPFGWLSRRDQEIVERVMEETGTRHLAERLLSETSGGEKQRVLIAMALAQEPDLMLLDEPTSHLDIHHQFEVMELLARLNRARGTTIVATFHDINLAAAYCNDVLLLDRGELVAHGPPACVLTAERLSTVYKARAWAGKNPYLESPLFLFAPEEGRPS